MSLRILAGIGDVVARLHADRPLDDLFVAG